MEYPKDFPEHLKPAVDAALHEAEARFLDDKKDDKFVRRPEIMILYYIQAVYIPFTKQCCRAVEEGAWNGETVRARIEKFLKDLIHAAWWDKHPDPSSGRDAEFYFAKSVTNVIRDSDEWHDVQRELARIAKTKSVLPVNATPERAKSVSVTSGTDSLAPMLDAVSTRLRDYGRDLNKERDAAYESVKGQAMAGGCMGRGAKRFAILEEFASRRVRKQVEIYQAVAEEFNSEEMLSGVRLETLRQTIKTAIHNECLGIHELNIRDCHAAGDGAPSALEASAKRLPGIEARIFDAANDKLRVIESTEAARRAMKPLRPPMPIVRPIRDDIPEAYRKESTGSQIRRLMDESHLTAEQIAPELDVDPRSIYRHIADEARPRKRHLRAYEKVFSQALDRKVLITDTSVKSH